MTEAQRIAQEREAQRLNDEHPFICPNCDGQCNLMGLGFKAPKVSDLKAWRVVEAPRRLMANPALNLAPFGLWTALKRRRLPLR